MAEALTGAGVADGPARHHADRRRSRGAGGRARPDPRHGRATSGWVWCASRSTTAASRTSSPTPSRGRRRRRVTVTDPSRRRPRAAASSTTWATGPTPARGSGREPSLAPWSLTGFRNTFGLGRSGKSKVLPFILLGLNLMPAVIVGGVHGVRRARRAADRLRGVRVDHPGAPRYLRRLAGPGALLARPPARHDLAVPGAAAAVEHLRPGPLGRAARARPWSSCCSRSSSCTPWRCSGSWTSPSRPARPRVAVGLAVLLALALAGVAGLIASLVDPPRVRRGRHHRPARHRQRHRDRHPGHRRARRASPEWGRWPGCSRRTRSTAA